MRKKVLSRWLIVVTVAVVILGSLLALQTVGAGSIVSLPGQHDIEGIAVAAARHGLEYAQLQSSPLHVQSKQMTLGEFRARLDPFSQDVRDSAINAWLVLIEGDVEVGGPPPATANSSSVTHYDNMWVLVSVGGAVLASGAQGPGNELDLNKPPVPRQSWATPANSTPAGP